MVRFFVAIESLRLSRTFFPILLAMLHLHQVRAFLVLQEFPVCHDALCRFSNNTVRLDSCLGPKIRVRFRTMGHRRLSDSGACQCDNSSIFAKRPLDVDRKSIRSLCCHSLPKPLSDDLVLLLEPFSTLSLNDSKKSRR